MSEHPVVVALRAYFARLSLVGTAASVVCLVLMPVAVLLYVGGNQRAADTAALRAYLADLDNRGFATSSVARRLSALRHLFRFMLSERIRADDPAAILRPDQAGRIEAGEALESAQREALSYFGRSECYVERYLTWPRHVEMQVIADTHGNYLWLGERDCSAQRRHQKLIEESPSPNLPAKVRKSICDAAVRMIRAANYTNAGTVEFIVDQKDNFYFIEVNPRVQVEHTVTEEVTGIDIVKAQIQIAAGARIGTTECGVPYQDAIRCNGHALQCRITTEDPEANFIPDYGKIYAYRTATGFGIRLDGGTTYTGAMITRFYDSLLEKVTAWAPTAAEAIARMDRALREFRIRGVKTNIAFLLNLIDHPTFREGAATTTFIDDTPELFHIRAPRDRATRMLSYLGDVIVNGRSDVKKVADGRKLATPVPPKVSHLAPPPPGMRMTMRSLFGTVCTPMPRSFLPDPRVRMPAAPLWPPSRPRGGWSMRS